MCEYRSLSLHRLLPFHAYLATRSKYKCFIIVVHRPHSGVSMFSKCERSPFPMRIVSSVMDWQPVLCVFSAFEICALETVLDKTYYGLHCTNSSVQFIVPYAPLDHSCLHSVSVPIHPESNIPNSELNILMRMWLYIFDILYIFGWK